MESRTKLLHLCLFLNEMNIVSIIIGLVIWLVVPIITNDVVKKKAHKKAIAMLCKIFGIAIIAVSIINYLSSIFQ